MITQGEWHVTSSTVVCDEEARIIANCFPVGIPALDININEAVCNANLIAQAGNVANSTGLMPDELLEAFLKYADHTPGCEFLWAEDPEKCTCGYNDIYTKAKGGE